MTNLFSVDVEDYFCVENMRAILPREKWDGMELRVEANVATLLDLFDASALKATFFVLGWVAQKVPHLITEIERRGHEIATHGFGHAPLYTMDASGFERDLAASLEAIAKCAKQTVVGYRAPSFSLTPKTTWALPVLERNGIRYDSSVFPTSLHPAYSFADADLSPYDITPGLKEVPISCVEWFGKRFPSTGGAYFRLFPYLFTKMLFRQCNRQGRPVVFYLHPWEIDPGQPRFRLPATRRFRHYCNLGSTLAKVKRLLKDFAFSGIRKAIYG
jgi:polysaccharide deacetylase family protein (PEP-CTERM system associated)